MTSSVDSSSLMDAPSLIVSEPIGSIPETTVETTAVASAGRSDRWIAIIGIALVSMVGWSVLGVEATTADVSPTDGSASDEPEFAIHPASEESADVSTLLPLDPETLRVAAMRHQQVDAALGARGVTLPIVATYAAEELVMVDPATGEHAALTSELEVALRVHSYQPLANRSDSFSLLAQALADPAAANTPRSVVAVHAPTRTVLRAGSTELIVASAGGVYEQRGSERVKVADGIGLAASENLVLVYQCDDNLRCGMRWLDRSTGEDMGYPVPSIPLGSPIVVSPDGQTMIVSDWTDQSTSLWNVPTGEQVGTLKSRPLDRPSFSDDSMWAVYSVGDGNTRLLSLATLTEFSLAGKSGRP